MTRLTLMIAPLLPIFAIISACDHKRDEPPQLITKSSPSLVSQLESVNSTLASKKVTFNSSYRDYSSEGLVPPCDGILQQSLENALREVTEIQRQLEPNKDLFRDEALDFSRKVDASQQSLTTISRAIGEYCKSDYVNQNPCFTHRVAILVKINDHTAGTSGVHPFLQLDPYNSITIFMYKGDNDVRVFPLTEPYGKLATLGSLESYSRLSQCLDSMSKDTQSALSKDILLTAKTAQISTARYCENLVEKNLRSADDQLNQFCGLPKLGN